MEELTRMGIAGKLSFTSKDCTGSAYDVLNEE